MKIDSSKWKKNLIDNCMKYHFLKYWRISKILKKTDLIHVTNWRKKTFAFLIIFFVSFWKYFNTIVINFKSMSEIILKDVGKTFEYKQNDCRKYICYVFWNRFIPSKIVFPQKSIISFMSVSLKYDF